MTDVTRSEYCAVAIADCFADDGEIMGSPMGLLPTLGARLAKNTSNPRLLLTDGEARILRGTPPLGQTADVTEGWMPFRLVLESVVTYGKRHVMMGATQIDRHGNQNISAIGPWDKPTRQLLGVRGAPGNTVNNKTSYWVPKHSARVVVEQVDIVSGIGRARAEAAGPAATRFHDVHRLVTNLGVFDFGGPEHTLRFVSVHPGVTVEEVREASGCEIHADGDVPETRTPTDARAGPDPRAARPHRASASGKCRTRDRPAAVDAAHRADRRTPSRRPDRHGLGRRPEPRQRHRQRRRPRHPRLGDDDARRSSSRRSSRSRSAPTSRSGSTCAPTPPMRRRGATC